MQPRAAWADNQPNANEPVRFSPRRRARPGISLLEVLVSIFILLFGILGVFSMMLAGKWHVLKANRYDRAASLGQAAFNDIQVRRLLPPLNSGLWVDRTGMAVATAFPLAVDPFGASTIWNPHVQQRTLDGLTSPLNAIGPPADAVFVSRDDLVVTYPNDGDLPSEQPQAAAGQRMYDGHYSWIFTVANATSDSRTISVAVFYKRDLQAEVAVSITDPLVGGPGGGEIQIPINGSPSIPLDGGSAPQLAPGNWLLLSGDNAGNPFAAWYRILNRDKNTAGDEYRVLLAGPDRPDLTSPTVALFDSVISVYEKNVSIKELSLWGE